MNHPLSYIRFLFFLLFVVLDLSVFAQSPVKLRGASYNDSVFYNPLFVNKLTLPDVCVFNGGDGCYYMIGSESLDRQCFYKSTDLIEWNCTDLNPYPDYVKEQIKKLKQPTNIRFPQIRIPSGSWAPNIVKVGKKFNLYTSAGAYGGIICLQSDKPTGPYTFSRFDKEGNPLKLVDLDDVGMEFDVIDPCFVRDTKIRKNYLFFGSSFGIYRVELSKDGTRVKKNAKYVHIAGSTDRGEHGIDYEGTMLYRHGDYWYLILSPRRDYRLLCWRSKSLTGEFRDKEGNTPFSNKYGWEILSPQSNDYLTPEGYYLTTSGHSGEIVKDKVGRYFIFCHVRVTRPDVGGYGHRVPCLTEIVWDEDGWPIANTKDHKVSYENIKPVL